MDSAARNDKTLGAACNGIFAYRDTELLTQKQREHVLQLLFKVLENDKHPLAVRLAGALSKNAPSQSSVCLYRETLQSFIQDFSCLGSKRIAMIELIGHIAPQLGEENQMHSTFLKCFDDSTWEEQTKILYLIKACSIESETRLEYVKLILGTLDYHNSPDGSFYEMESSTETRWFVPALEFLLEFISSAEYPEELYPLLESLLDFIYIVPSTDDCLSLITRLMA